VTTVSQRLGNRFRAAARTLYRPAAVPVAALAALAMLAPLALPALAQTEDRPRNGTRFQDWVLNCRAEAVNQTSCAITQSLVRQADEAFLAEFGLNRVQSDDKPQTVMIVRTPAGMDLRVDPAYRIDESEESTTLSWRTCAGDFCSAVLTLDEAQTEALRQGAQMTFGYRPFGANQPVAFAVSLSGVSDGLDALD
jgi:invasion protein IalB